MRKVKLPVKVLHVVPAIAPRYGGTSRAVLEMSRAIQLRGVEVLIATTDADGAGRLPVEVGRPLLYGGVPILFFSRQWSEAFKYSRPMARWLAGHVREFDVVHIHAVLSHVCLTAARRCARQGVPYLLGPHGTLDPWSLGRKRVRKSLLLHLAGVQSVQGAAFVHYTTEEERRLAELRLPIGRGVVVPLGVDPELLDGGDCGTGEGRAAEGIGATATPYVLALGRIHEKKGLELLVDAFLDVTKQEGLSEWRLVIAGDGEPKYVAQLRARAARQDPQKRVLFVGWLQGPTRIEVLRRAALMASPSHQENFGLSVVEALACGVPAVVSSHVNLAAEIVDAGAGWVTPLERSALVASLQEAMRDEPERLRRGRAGRELVRRRFTWPMVADQLIAVYEAAVARSSAVSA